MHSLACIISVTNNNQYLTCTRAGIMVTPAFGQGLVLMGGPVIAVIDLNLRYRIAALDALPALPTAKQKDNHASRPRQPERHNRNSHQVRHTVTVQPEGCSIDSIRHWHVFARLSHADLGV